MDQEPQKKRLPTPPSKVATKVLDREKEPNILPQTLEENQLAVRSSSGGDQPSSQIINKEEAAHQRKTIEDLIGHFMDVYMASDNKSKTTAIFIQKINEIWQQMQELPADTQSLFLNIFRQYIAQISPHLEKGDLGTITDHLAQLEREALNLPHENVKALEMEKRVVRKPTKSLRIANFYDNPAELSKGELLAGGNTDPVQLIQKTLERGSTKETKSCFQFYQNDREFIFNTKPSPCMDISILKSHLYLTNIVYENAIDKIIKNAYRSLVKKIPFNIEKTDIDTILDIYMQNSRYKIDPTLTMLDADEVKDLEKYMLNCTAVYTDFNTRSFLIMQDLPSVKKVYQEIINGTKKIEELINEIKKIQSQLTSLRTQDTLAEETGMDTTGRFAVKKQVLSFDEQEQYNKKQATYRLTIIEINKFLMKIGEKQIENDDLRNISDVQDRLNKIKVWIDSENSWHFERVKKKPKEWAINLGNAVDWVNTKFLGGEQKEEIPNYIDTESEEHQLTAKSVVASSFLSKSKFIKPDNIIILDVGFRNEQTLGTMMNKLMTSVMSFKKNKKAWFENRGEVDFVAYIERDTSSEKRDKLVIVYSGSNSDVD